MKVKYVEAQGGQLVMDNVTTLRLIPGALVLEGLLDGVRTVPGTTIDRIDFDRGETLITASPPHAATPATAEAG